MNDIDHIPADMILELVMRRPTRANEIKGCREINLSGGQLDNPDWKEGSGTKKYLEPHEILQKHLDDGWIVANLFYKRDDGPTNFGHNPTVNHALVAVVVKVK